MYGNVEYAYPPLHAAPLPRPPTWRAVAPYPEVFVPHDPYTCTPFVPYYPVPGGRYARSKDFSLGAGSAARLPPGMPGPTMPYDMRGRIPPSPAPAPPGYQHMVPHYLRTELAEVNRGPIYDDDIWLGDDDDLFGDDDDIEELAAILFGEDKKKKIRPFAAISKLFRKEPGKSKTRAEEALEAAQQLRQQAAQLLPGPQQQRPVQQGYTGTQTAMIAGGVGVAMFGIGFMAARALAK